jgi:Type III secretion system, cytoplasmic E component of needle
MSEAERDGDIVELKKVLREDESGEVTQSMIQSLRKAAAPISMALRGTLSREDYVMSEELLQALTTAEEVLKTVWERIHPNRPLMV